MVPSTYYETGKTVKQMNISVTARKNLREVKRYRVSQDEANCLL
jgi:hypothetical protein